MQVDRWSRRGRWTAWSLLLAAGAATAEPDGKGHAALPGRFEISTLESAPSWPEAARAGPGLRTRWWWGRGGLELGLGADWARRPLGMVPSPRGGTTQVFALRAALSPRTQILYETDATRREAGDLDPPFEPFGAVQGTRLAVEFKLQPAAPLKSLRDGLLRMQVSGSSSLQFKPRSGGLFVSYRATF